MHGAQYVLQVQFPLRHCRVQAEGAGQGFIDRELVGLDVPEPGADDGPGGQCHVDAVGGPAVAGGK
ncbi:hypothetical protein D3C81_1381260 [compost metagenome]